MSYIPQVSGDPKTLRSGALTTAFDSSPAAIRMQNWNQAVFYLDVALDTATDVRVRFDVATPAVTTGAVIDTEPDASSSAWYQLPSNDGANTTVATGVQTVPQTIFEAKYTVSGRYVLPLQMNYKWVRCRAKATGTVGSATLGVNITQGMA